MANNKPRVDRRRKNPHIQMSPFQGTTNTRLEKPLIPSGGFSMIQNIRSIHPGFEQRLGQIKHHSIESSGRTTKSLFGLSKGDVNEIITYRQLDNGLLEKGTDNPPSTTTGAFGTTELTAMSGTIPASYAVLNDVLMYADGKRQHQVNSNTTYPVAAFISYTASTVPSIPVEGKDYQDEVTDGQSGTVAVVAAGDHHIFVMSPTRMDSLTLTITVANTNISTIDVQYWKGSWASTSGQSDGTLSSNATLGQTGTISWTRPTDELPHFQFGMSGFWYKLDLTGATLPVGTNLLIHCDGTDGSVTFTDDSDTGHTITVVGTAQVDTAIKKYGTGALLLDGNSDYIETPDHADFQTGTSDWEIEGYAYTTDITSQDQPLLAKKGGTRVLLQYNQGSVDDKIALYLSSDAVSWDIASASKSSVLSLSNNTMFHWLLSYDGSAYRLFIDGTVVTTVTSSTDIKSDTNGWRFGNDTATSYWNGGIDEIRFQLAGTVKTSNFTPPLGAYGVNGAVSISEASYSSTFHDLVNVWDGVMVDAIEAQVYDSAQTNYYVYGSNSVDIGKLKTGDYVYVGFIDPIVGMYIDPGATPNIVKATLTGSSDIDFIDGATGQDSIVNRGTIDFLAAGFRAGMSIDITGTSSNNITVKIISVTSSTIKVPTGKLTAEVDQSATLTFALNTTALDLVEVWTGAGWTSVGTITDDTDGVTKAGFVTWDRTQVTPQRVHFNETQYYAYWYRVSFDKQLQDTVNVGFEGMPYFDIEELGLGVSVAVWKERAVYSFDQFGQYIYLSRKDAPMMLNGSDYGIIEVGDGRAHRVRSMKKFYNELIVWQEEKGDEGGCTTLLEGYSPQTFGKLVLSTKVGIMNSNCSAVVDGVLTSTASEEKIKTLAFWLSRYGVMMSDGRTISVISDDIGNYFDPSRSEVIRKGYEDQMWLAWDESKNVIRVGLVSGGSATTPNIFPVFDLVDKTWSFDNLGQNLSCLVNVEAASGDIMVRQLGGGADDGFVYQLNQTDDDVSTAIDAYCDLELDGGGGLLHLREVLLRNKHQAAGNCTVTFYKDGNTGSADSQNFPLQASITNDSYRRNREQFDDILANHLTVRFQNNTASQSLYLEDVGFHLTVEDSRR